MHSFQARYTRPRCGPLLRSTASEGNVMPRGRLNPGAPLPKLENIWAPVTSVLKLAAPFVDFRTAKRSRYGEVCPIAYQVAYTSPAGPTATREPWTNPASASAESWSGSDQLSPPLAEDWTSIVSLVAL